ncbi:hypothetical protein M3Y99_00956800 [Aphelenchoides fujianensis]|nr:hypothetical protein M3Y99_00956800 [Aphelenchoides fujianensis]
MSILAAPRRKQRISTDPRNTSWKAENTAGKAMLERMGWREGAGLGRREQGMQENLKLKANLTGRGLGKEEHRSTEHWIAHNDDFELLLAKLNDKSKGKAKAGDSQADETPVQSAHPERVRLLKRRFTRAKDLSIVSSTMKAGIFGNKSKQTTRNEQVEVEERKEEATTESSTFDDNLVVSTASATDLYKEKMRKWAYFGAQKEAPKDEEPETESEQPIKKKKKKSKRID